MATTGNARYLKYIFLLGEGVLLVLRGIVRREVLRTGSTLDSILTNPTNRRHLERNCHSQTQRLHLFPSHSTVNSDIETWDISLLTLVIQKVFWSNLSRDERLRISYLRDSRNEYQGHPPEMSMEETAYNTRSTDLTTTLQDLASAMDQQTRDKLTRIINDSNAVQFDFHTAINHLQQLYEFKESMVEELEKRFKTVNAKLDDVKVSASKPREMPISERECLKNIEKGQERISWAVEEMLRIKKMIIHQTKHDTSKDLQTIMQAQCDDQEKQDKAIDLLYSFVKLIQGENTFTEQEIRSIILQRIQYYMHDGELTLQLIEDILDWFVDMHANPDASPGNAHLGSILIPVQCSSVSGLLKHIEYMDSIQCQQRLFVVSSTVSKLLGFSCSLSWTIVPGSFQSVLQKLYKTSESKKIVLPFKSSSLKGLTALWKMFGGEETNSHIARISKTLSQIFGVNIIVKASVDRDQFQKAVHETSSKLRQSEQMIDVSKALDKLTTIFKDSDSHSSGMDVDILKSVLDDAETKKITDSKLRQSEQTFDVSKALNKLTTIFKDSDSQSSCMDQEGFASVRADEETKKITDCPAVETTLNPSVLGIELRTHSTPSNLQEQPGIVEIQSKKGDVL